MKFFTVFVAIVAMATASPAEWSLNELSTAIQNPNTPASLLPVLEAALDELMLSLFTGNPQTTTTVSTAVQDFSAWTLHELSEAIMDPATDPHLLVYLEHALNSIMADIFSGGNPEYIIVATPVGLLPVDSVVIPAPVESVVVPPTVVEPVVTPTASSPLVQIIVNVKSQEQAPVVPEPVIPEVVVPGPVVLPMPVVPEVIAPEPVVLPQPILPEVVVPAPVVLPQPILPEVIVPGPVVLPMPILPEVGVNPIDIISVNPESSVNPIDVIAITAPEVNPVDIIAPVAVNPVGVGIVGPIV